MGDWITETPQGVIQTLATVQMQATKQVEITFNCHIKEEATQLSLLFVRLRFSSRVTSLSVRSCYRLPC